MFVGILLRVKTNPIPQHDATSTVMFTDISNNKVINPKFG